MVQWKSAYLSMVCNKIGIKKVFNVIKMSTVYWQKHKYNNPFYVVIKIDSIAG